MNQTQTVFQSYVATPTTTAAVDLFTCPSKTKGILRSIVVANPDTSSTDTYTIHLRPAGTTLATTTVVIPAKSVSTSTYDLISPDLGLNESDVLTVVAGAGNVLNVIASVELQSVYL